MRRKPGIPFEQYFPRVDRGALALLKRLLAFDPTDRPSAEEALADPYFYNLHSPAREPTAQAISKLAFEFERRKLAIDEVRELIYREILEYHPQVLQDYLSGGRLPTFLYPSAVDNFKRQFMHLEGGGILNGSGGAGGIRGGAPGQRPIVAATSLPRERVAEFQAEAAKYIRGSDHREDLHDPARAKLGHHAVDSLGSCVRSMTVMDQCGPVPAAYPGYPNNPIIRSSSYQPTAMQRH